MNTQSGGEHKGFFLLYFNRDNYSYITVVQNNDFDLY